MLPSMLGKTSVATCSNSVHTALNSGWYSARCSVHHVRSECVQRKITCKGETVLSLKTTSFLHSQSDHSKAYAPTLISVLYAFEIPSSQWPKILATLVGGYKFDAIWMADHVERANLQWKKRCLIVSSWVQKQHFFLPNQLFRAGLSFVSTTPLWRYHVNILTLSGTFAFQFFCYYSPVPQNVWVHDT